MISAEEVAAQIRRAIAGEVDVSLADVRFQWSSGGDIDFVVGDWNFRIFNDCDSLDYVDCVELPDGRAAGFDDWVTDDSQNNPVDFLSRAEIDAFEELLCQAR